MGFSISEAQWLIQFFRNLPGNRPAEPTEEEYRASWAEQRAQAEAQQNAPVQLAWTYDDPENPSGY
jgi:hypothetical protein